MPCILNSCFVLLLFLVNILLFIDKKKIQFFGINQNRILVLDKSEQNLNPGWNKSSIFWDKPEQNSGLDKSKQNSGLNKSEQSSGLNSDWEYFWSQNPYLVDLNPKYLVVKF